MEVAIETVQPSAPAEPAGGGDKLDNIILSAYDAVEGEAPPEPESSGRARDDKGRFASSNPADAQPSTTDPAVAEAKPAEVPPVEPAVQPLEPHPRWAEADKARFATLPREAQEFLLNREKATEADYTRKTQEIAEQRKSIEPLVNETLKHDQLFRHIGTTPDRFMSESAAVATNLLTGSANERGQAIAYLVNRYSIPPEAVVHALGIPLHGGENGQPTADPHVATLVQQISQLKHELGSIREQSTISERQRAEAEFNALALAKDEAGQPKFPHFERVRQSMIQLASTGAADTWDAAYSKAVRLDDDLYKETVESAAKREREALEKARQEAVEKARKAAPVHTSNSQPRGGSANRGMDAHIEQAMAKAGF